MKLKIMLILLTFIFGSCQQLSEMTKAKPVEIDGFSSLQLIKDKDLTEEQLTKIIKTIAKIKSVNEEDALAMLEIYKKYGDAFLSGSRFSHSEERLSIKDVENYLSSILKYETLRDEANLITQTIITKRIQKSVSFESNVTNSAIGENIGTLAGGYVNAFNKAVDDNRQNESNAYGKQQAENKFNIIYGFEQAASEPKKITDEEKENIEQFLADLKLYNESLPKNAKILDGNGKLISPSKMTDPQKDSMENIFSNETNKAGQNLSERMRPIYERLVVFTNQQVEK